MLNGILLPLPMLPAGVPPGSAIPVSVDTLRCQVHATTDGNRRCTVRIPEGRRISACLEANRPAGPCDPKGEGRQDVWHVANGGARCQISRKRTNWVHRVTLSLKDSTPAGAAACDLYVVLE